MHRYFGKSIRKYRGTGVPRYFKRGYATEHDLSIPHASFDDLPFEYPLRGHGDYRIPAFEIKQENGISYADLTFTGLKITDGKPEIPGLPSITASGSEAKTLEITCEDDRAGLRVTLYYTVIGEEGVILRHQKIENTGTQTLKLENAQSLSLELPARDYDFFSLYGTHAKEANRFRFRIHHGIQKTESVRGSSSPQHQPSSFWSLPIPRRRKEKSTLSI